jgi:hypothetical protein
MVEPTGHCPYLGLKQNQAIRFASPTPEHRCYAAGQAQEIPLVQPDYQTAFCLSPNHVKCPLYTGSGLPSTPLVAIEPRSEPALAAAGGLGGWLAGLPRRDRLIYLTLLGLLGVILTIYAAAGIGLLRNEGLFPGGPTGAPPLIPSATSTAPAMVLTEEPTSTPTTSATATATARPSVTASPRATPTETVSPRTPHCRPWRRSPRRQSPQRQHFPLRPHRHPRRPIRRCRPIRPRFLSRLSLRRPRSRHRPPCCLRHVSNGLDSFLLLCGGEAAAQRKLSSSFRPG